jgi:NAD(P)-dependent dehydrogenase (short-subunit alcohol dehydrogenase family)
LITNVAQESATYPNAAYATSKVAVHWLTKRMNAEEDKLTAFAISPGWCQTDMGNTGAQAFGMGEAPIKVEDSCSQMVPLIEGTTKESHGGKLWNYEGDQMTW